MKTALYIIITALLICFAYYLGQKDMVVGDPEIITYTDTVPGDSVPYAVYYPTPVPDTILYPDTVPQDIDTAQIIAEYLATVFYNDTLKDDTSALIVLNEQVSRNRIIDRSMVFQNRRPTAINTTIINPSQHQDRVFLGIQAILGQRTEIMGVGMYKAKKLAYTVGVSNNGTVMVGVMWGCW